MRPPRPTPSPEPVAYGGQAVLEGVMMRGRRKMAVAVRAPSGEVVVWEEELRPSRLARRVGGWPVVRGAVLLAETMALGVRSLAFSSTVLGLGRSRDDAGGADGGGQAAGARLWGLVALSALFATGVFFVTPLLAVVAVEALGGSEWAALAAEAAVRLGLFFGYLLAIGRREDIRRVFAYHGAEHKAVHAWEAGDPLEVAHVRRHPLEHPRCGTAFMLVVMVLAVLVFLPLGRLSLPALLASRVVLVPLIAGAAYEVLKLAVRPGAPRALRAALAPTRRLQRLTTREPDDAMLEVAIAALVRVLAADGQAPVLAPLGGRVAGEPSPEPLAAD